MQTKQTYWKMTTVILKIIKNKKDIQGYLNGLEIKELDIHMSLNALSQKIQELR